MANILINIGANIGSALTQLRQLGQGLSQLANQARSAATAVGGSRGMNTALNAASNGVNGLANRIGRASSAIGNFNTIARVGTSSARAIGTSMIFAGGAFRDLGVGINVAASLFQTFIPIISAFTAALGPAGALLIPFAGNLVAMGAVLGTVGAGLFEVARRGIAFNAALESNIVTVGTLIAEFKNLQDAQGNLIGSVKEFNAAAFEQLSITEQQTEIDNRRNAATLRIVAGQEVAKQAVVALTVAAADSVYTTQQLMGAFQATYSVLGRFGATAKQTAGLTVELARVASVAGVSAANLASQLTLFLTGAGRITSPLSRFAASIGLTKEYMAALRNEFKAATGDVDKTQKIFNKLTNILTVFSVGGRLMSDTWTGIMSNLSESLDLFAGSATTGIFEKIRDAIFSIETDAQGAIIRVSGALSKVFKIDPKTGTFFKTIERQLEVFQEPIQRAITSLNTLFSIIGDDISTAIAFVFDKVVGLADWLGNNEDKVVEIYYGFRDILETVGEVVRVLLSMFGVSEDIDATVENINDWLYVIRFSLGTIATVLAGIQFLVGLFILGIGTIIKGLGSVAYFAAVVVEKIREWGIGLYNVQVSISNIIGGIINFISRLLGLGEIVIPIKFAVFNQEEANRNLQNFWESTQSPGNSVADFGFNIANTGANNAERIRLGGQAMDERAVQRSADRKLRADQIRVQLRAERTSDGQRLFTEEQLAGMSDNQLIRLQRETQSKNKTNKKVTEVPKLGGLDTESGGKKGRGRDTSDDRLKSLFSERQKLAEAQLDLIRSKENEAFDAIQENLRRQETALKSQLDTFRISYSDYYRALETIRQTDLAAERQHIENLINIENQRFQFAQDALDQERADAEENFKRNGNEAKYKRELQAIDIKADTERIKYQKDIASIKAKGVQIDADSLEVRRKNAVEEAENLRKLRATLREFQTDFDETIGNLSTDTQQRAVDKVKFALAQQVRDLQQQLGTDKAINAEIEKQINNLGVIFDLQSAIIANKFAQERLDREQALHTERIADLESQRNRGVFSTTEYNRRVINENRAYAVELRKLLDSLAEQRANLPADSKEAADAAIRIAQLKREITELETASEDVLFGAIGDARSGLVTFFQDIQSDVKGVGDAVIKLGQTILGTVQKLLAEAAVRQFMKFFLGEEGQTEGKAGGIFAKFLRLFGVDPNSDLTSGNNKPVVPTGGSVSIGGEVEVATGRAALEETVKTLNSEFSPVAVQLNQAGVTLNAAGNKLGVYADKLQRIEVDRTGTGGTTITPADAVGGENGGLANQDYTFMPLLSDGAPGDGGNTVQLVAVPAGVAQRARADLNQRIGQLSTPTFAGGDAVTGATPEVIAQAPTTDAILKEIAEPTKQTVNPIVTFIDAKLSDILKAIRETKQASQETKEAIDGASEAVGDVATAGAAGGVSLIGSLKQLGNWLGKAFSMLGGFISQLFGGGGGGTVDVIFNGITGIAKAGGGYIRGRGTTTSDSIPAMLSDQEYVVKAASVKKLGVPFLEFINKYGTIPKFAGGGWLSRLFGGGSGGGLKAEKLPLGTKVSLPGGGTASSGSSFWGGKIGGALKGGAISAGISIGMALLGRWMANRQYKKDLEEYKKNRTKDPYGLNPETLTYYKKPIISGSRNWLALGGLVQKLASGGLASNKSVLGSLSLAGGGLADLDSMSGVLAQLEGNISESAPVNIRQNVNIQTPDIHSFRNSRAAIERDMSRLAQRGTRRRPPRY